MNIRNLRLCIYLAISSALVVVIFSGCGGIPVRVIMPTNAPLPTYTYYPTYTPLPSSNAGSTINLPGVPTAPVGVEEYYQEVLCPSKPHDPIDSMRCFDLNTGPGMYLASPATIFYKDGYVYEIAIGGCESSHEVLHDGCRMFLTRVGDSADWNLDDIKGALDKVLLTQENEWVKYNSISASRNKESGYWTYYFLPSK
jgi:hypothetical protein